MLRSMKEKGFTLIEVVVVLGIIAVLSAILIPVTANYLSEAKITKAKRDAATIANSIQQFQKDTGEWPRWVSGASQADTGLEDDRYIVLHTEDGDRAEASASLTTGLTTTTTTDWNKSAADDVTDTSDATPADIDGDSLDDQLNGNLPGYPATGFFRSWRGPYLPGLKGDPWGNKYYVNVKYLIGEVGRALGTVVPEASLTGDAVTHASEDQGRHCFVLSAGPNEIIETEFDQLDSVVLEIGGDDIIHEIK